MESCFHCGDECRKTLIKHQEKSFCCNGCKTVYDILNDNDLSYYYDLEHTPGTTPVEQEGKFDFLESNEIISQLLEFNEQGIQVISLLIPSIHCSSCIWVLENLQKLQPGVKTSQVNFPEKTVRITYSSADLNLQDLVLLLSKLGYEPYISLEDTNKQKTDKDRSLIYKLGVAGFAFGNIMFLSFPEYFEVNEFWLEKYKHVFRWLMFIFSLPVVFYSGRDYFISAFKGLRSKILNIDVPIAIGITVLFTRSFVDVLMDWGSGFFDSLAGLVFFLLLGRFFQQKTYAYLSFERDYKSYFPIAVTRIFKNIDGDDLAFAKAESGKSSFSTKKSEQQIQVNDLQQGDRILIRNNELLPVDGVLINGNALIDYSFATGEAEPVAKTSGDHLFAGGRQLAGSIEVEVLKSMEQSYLTQLWSNEVFSKKGKNVFQSLTDQISRRFTITLLLIAIVATAVWLFIDTSIALNVFTSVLIVACPCAIALAAPFTLGNLLRIFGRHKLYMKDTSSIEQMAHIDLVVFDKTGTLTTNSKNTITYEGVELDEDEKSLLSSTLRSSNHPLSRSLYEMLDQHDIKTLDDFQEEVGKGVTGTINDQHIKIGSFEFLGSPEQGASVNTHQNTAVHICYNNTYKGCFIFYNEYRDGVQEVFNQLKKSVQIVILSGDNDGEREHLASILPANTTLLFNQKPEDKLNYIKNQQRAGKTVLMVGDGLNDAGALAQSNVGITISENINVFSPACDGILDASRFSDINTFLSISKNGLKTIKYAFIFSLFYNMIGLGFALTGKLAPVVAAILMPLSSISIVIFTTVITYLLGRKLKSN
ncbi:Cu+-exporting ATPase [Nonlabens dokdonensis]|uniref:Cu+-exporting ATPase n=2 Tax=Nonlabens dokdonensis TaxID=328515 RepID=A0ABX5PZ12_9FLAO|nr:heavy metal translocating P-type ATPase metal-binding domain-containing protein [Nonlabens dokdonensis]AGC75320.1 putative cation-transporting P-type ATPase [Nonlabens dokdonensis DSW-6]PZX43028.1 Cu+-exporting ATPase [Nonlabens dokdonensis]